MSPVSVHVSDSTDTFDDLEAAQAALGEWSREQFGDQDAVNPLVGAQEELGEVARLELKQRQGIRQDELADEPVEQEVADVVIYLMDYCERRDIDLAEGLDASLDKVLDRDFDADVTE